MDIFQKQVEVDFGLVCLNSKPVKTFKVQNNNTIDQVFKVAKWSKQPKLDPGFIVRPLRTPAVKSGDSFEFSVEFLPSVARQNCSTTFIIGHLFGVQTAVFAKAFVQGPACSLSVSELLMRCPTNRGRYEKSFALRNTGACPAYYQWWSPGPSVTMSPSHGIVRAGQELRITAAFTPTDRRPRFYRIFCLLNSQEPLIIKVLAVWQKSGVDVVQESLSEYGNGYECYLLQATSGPVLLERDHVDFQHCQPRRHVRHEFSVKNQSSAKLSIEWAKDSEQVFKIQPERAVLDVNASVLFTASFSPPARDKLYGIILDAQLYSDSGMLPVPVDINLKGHSFDELSCGWLPQYRVEPLVVTLPPCHPCPFRPSHATLIIHRLGHLPLTFAFHPPPHSNFCVKPQQGIIHGGFQIVVVQFQPKTLNVAIYSERWTLSFNSNDNVNQCVIQLSGSVEEPQVIVNNGDDVVFSPVHPGVVQEAVVDLYNPTRFLVSYKLKVLKGCTEVVSVGGGEELLWPDEHRQATWQFCPQGEGRLEGVVQCTPAGGLETTVFLRGTCLPAMLKVEPERMNFLQVLRGFKHVRGFKLTNIGDSFIEANLISLPDKGETLTEIEVEFNPQTFKLQPSDSIVIDVSVRPLKTGKAALRVGYAVKNMYTTSLLSLTFESVYPSLQVTDIRLFLTGPLFSKLDFWKFLQLSRLNQVLLSLAPGPTQVVDMVLPSYSSGTPPLAIQLFVENVSGMNVRLTLAARQMCGCVPVLTPISFSRSQWKDPCPHKSQLRIVPASTNIEAHSSVVLSVEVSYCTVGWVRCIYDMTLKPEDYEDDLVSRVELHVRRLSTAPGIPHVGATDCTDINDDFVFNMRPVCLSDKYPVAQAYWLYNNTSYTVPYVLDDTGLHGTPFKYISKRSVILPMSNHPLLFTFLPYCCQTTEAKVKLTLNNEDRTLILRGRGSLTALTKDYGDKIPVTATKHEEVVRWRPSGVFLSVTHINNVWMRPSSTNRHVLFINNSTADVINYKWNLTTVPDVLELRVHPAKGIISPGEFEECRVITYCKGWPCHVTATLTCVYSSVSQYVATIQAAQRHREKVANIADHFVINELGTFDVEVPPLKEKWPQKEYLTVSITTAACYSKSSDDSDVVLHTMCPLRLTPRLDSSLMTEEDTLYVHYVLERIIWDILKNMKVGGDSKQVHWPTVRYSQIKHMSDHSEVAVPRQTQQTALEDVLYSCWQDVFGLARRHSTTDRRTLLSSLYCLTEERSCGDSLVKLYPPSLECFSVTSPTP